MSKIDNIRIDKFLWAVRIFKTRGIASDACKKGRIVINNALVKPSRTVAKNDIVLVKKLPVIYAYKVIEPIEKRVSAKLTYNFIEDLTPENEKVKLIINDSVKFGYREKGTGRPTKKDRRTIDKLENDFKIV